MRSSVTLAISVVCLCLNLPALAQKQLPEQTHLSGRCSEDSHTTEGAIGSDLTKRRVRFVCDTMIVAFLDHYDKHIRVQFFHSKEKGREIGFAGVMKEGGQVMDVVLIYPTPSTSIEATDGACKFFFEKKSILDLVSMKSIFCGANIDRGGHRTVYSVVFNADPNQ